MARLGICLIATFFRGAAAGLAGFLTIFTGTATIFTGAAAGFAGTTLGFGAAAAGFAGTTLGFVMATFTGTVAGFAGTTFGFGTAAFFTGAAAGLAESTFGFAGIPVGVDSFTKTTLGGGSTTGAAFTATGCAAFLPALPVGLGTYVGLLLARRSAVKESGPKTTVGVTVLGLAFAAL
jgi:type VI secretion system secreted protein VgrG